MTYERTNYREVTDDVFGIIELDEPTESKPSESASQPSELTSDALSFLSWLGLTEFNLSFKQLGQSGLVGGTFSAPDTITLANESRDDDGCVSIWAAVNPTTRTTPSKSKLSNDDISRRLHLVFDLDPNDKTNPPTNKQDAINALDKLLERLGFAARMVIDSGNGGLILAKVDLPSKDWTHGRKGYVQRLYDSLNASLKSEGYEWHVDPQCKDASRIVGLPGTVNRKEGYAPTERRIISKTNGEPMGESEFRSLVDRIAPVAPAAERVPSVSSATTVTPDDSEFARKLFWAMLFEKYGDDDIQRTSDILRDAGFEVLYDDGEGVYIRSPYASEYSTPALDTDCKVYPSFGLSTFHSTDHKLDWDGCQDFCSRYLTSFYSDYQTKLTERTEEYKQSRKQRNERSLSSFDLGNDSVGQELQAELLTDQELADLLARIKPTEKLSISPDAFGPVIQNIASQLSDDFNFKDIGAPMLFCLMPFLGFVMGKNLICREKRFDMAKGSFRYPNFWLVMNAVTSGAKTKVLDALVVPEYGEANKFGADDRVKMLGNSINDLLESCGKVIGKRSKPEVIAQSIEDAKANQRQRQQGYFINADDDIEGFGKLSGNEKWSTKRQHLDLLVSGKDLSLGNKDCQRICVDSCISGIVTGQPERLKTEFPLDGKNIDSGLTGRLAYYSGGIEFEPGDFDKVTTNKAYARIKDLYSDDTTYEVTFDSVDVDEIWNDEREPYRRLAGLNANVASKMRAKFRDLAAVLSMIRGCVEKGVTVRLDEQDLSFDSVKNWSTDTHNGHVVKKGFDASEYFFGFYDLLCDCFYNYNLDLQSAKVDRHLEETILTTLSVAPAFTMSVADLKRDNDCSSGRSFYEFKTILESLIAKGFVDIERTKGKGSEYARLTDRGQRIVNSVIKLGE